LTFDLGAQRRDILQQQVIEFIQTIVIYKFPNLSQEEIETMLNYSFLKESKVYQEAFEEGKEEGKEEKMLEIIFKLLQKGFSIQEVADLLELDIETVRLAVQKP
jgi:predicted transposase/invertase (TIGR01784 family)